MARFREGRGTVRRPATTFRVVKKKNTNPLVSRALKRGVMVQEAQRFASFSKWLFLEQVSGPRTASNKT